MIEKNYKTYPVNGISRQCLFIIQMTRIQLILNIFCLTYTSPHTFNFWISIFLLELFLKL